MGKFLGPGYVRVGPVTAGVFGCGCLIPAVLIVATIAVVTAILIF